MKKENKLKRKIKWCLNQKSGIKLEEPNENLKKEYLKKAKSSLNMLNSALEKNEIDWIVTTAYYSRYFSLYALLQKHGIKSEIHDCSINLFKFLFIDQKLIDEKYFKEIKESKDLRVDFQYYVVSETNEKEIKKHSKKAREFVLEIEKFIENLKKKDVENIRDKLDKVIKEMEKEKKDKS